MGDLARYVMNDVSFRNAIGSMSSEPTHNGTKVSHHAAIHGGQRSTCESEFSSAVMGKDGVGVLEEGDEDEPVVDPTFKTTT